MSVTEVLMTVVLRKEMMGKDIVESVKKSIDKESADYYEVKSYIDGKVLFTVGQESQYPFMDLLVYVYYSPYSEKDLVLVDGRKHQSFNIDLEESYNYIAIQAHTWPGFKYPIGYNDDSVVEAVKSFRDKLKVELG